MRGEPDQQVASAIVVVSFLVSSGAMVAHLVSWLIGYTGKMGPLWWVALVGLLVYHSSFVVLMYTAS